MSAVCPAGVGTVYIPASPKVCRAAVKALLKEIQSGLELLTIPWKVYEVGRGVKLECHVQKSFPNLISVVNARLLIVKKMADRLYVPIFARRPYFSVIGDDPDGFDDKLQERTLDLLVHPLQSCGRKPANYPAGWDVGNSANKCLVQGPPFICMVVLLCLFYR